jgi:cytochrome c556
MKALRTFAGVFIGFAVVGSLLAGPSSADDFSAVIKLRQANLKELGGHMKALGTALQSGHADAATIGPQAQAIEALAKALPTWFPAGSGPETGIDTQALPAIWSNPAGFRAASDNFTAEAAKLAAVSSSGDAAAIGAQLKAVGDTCGACHKDFRHKL